MIILQLLIGFMVVLIAYVLVVLFLLSTAWVADGIIARTGLGDKTAAFVAFAFLLLTIALSWRIGAYLVP